MDNLIFGVNAAFDLAWKHAGGVNAQLAAPTS